jgi:hypothetical protein
MNLIPYVGEQTGGNVPMIYTIAQSYQSYYIPINLNMNDTAILHYMYCWWERPC